MLKTKTRARPSAPAPSAIVPDDVLKDALQQIDVPRTTKTIEAGSKVRGPAKAEEAPATDYPRDRDRVVRGTTHHRHSVGPKATGSALVVNSSDRTHGTHDTYSLSDAYERYDEEHPEWSHETKLLMASREDVNMGGDVVSARRRDWGGAAKSGKKWAGTIANTNYTKLKALGGVQADANNWKSRWVGQGFPTMGYTDKTGPGIEQAVEEVASHASPGAQIKLYYGGHGGDADGMIGVNAETKFNRSTGKLQTKPSVPWEVISKLGARAVSEGWHFEGIVDACESGQVAERLNDLLKPDVEKTEKTDYDIHTDEIREKGVPVKGGRATGGGLEELLYRQFVNSDGR